MTGAVATPRYSADDFETASVRSAAPSYVSEAPSYHSINPFPETVPPYTPPARTQAVARASLVPSGSGTSTPTTRQQTIGLPPVPAAPLRSQPNLNNFRIATWSSVSSNPTARHYQNVANRRMTAQQRDPVDSLRRAMTDIAEQEQEQRYATRPLEDPYLVGEVAAARARQERLARESGDDILIQEDRQWDWFLGESEAMVLYHAACANMKAARMRDSDERQRSWTPYRREAEVGGRKKLLRRIGGRRLL
ncbi:hypothetical protein F66182_11318 [Fusarium sp. NRRL 66182]|nr:hypothetical protein F66182_11318 [Fusarium sp. NRRL 66182]